MLIHQSLHLSPIYPSFIYLPWRRKWHPTPVLLPGESHGRRSLVGYSPWGGRERDSTERLHFPFSLYRSTNLAIICHHFLSIDLSIYLLYIHLFTHQPVFITCLSVICPSTYPIFCLSVCLFSIYSSAICLVTFLSTIYLSIYRPITFTYESTKQFIIYPSTHLSIGLPRGLSSKESCGQCRRRRRHKFDPWVAKIPWRRASCSILAWRIPRTGSQKSWPQLRRLSKQHLCVTCLLIHESSIYPPSIHPPI